MAKVGDASVEAVDETMKDLTLDGGRDVANETAALGNLSLADAELSPTATASKELPSILSNLRIDEAASKAAEDAYMAEEPAPQRPKDTRSGPTAPLNSTPLGGVSGSRTSFPTPQKEMPGLRQRVGPVSTGESSTPGNEPSTPARAQPSSSGSQNAAATPVISTPSAPRPILNAQSFPRATQAQTRAQLPLVSLPLHNPPNISSLSYILGLLSGLGLGFAFASTISKDMAGYGPLGMWFALLGAFHEAEYLGAATWRTREVNINSFLINHSTAYHAAFVFGLVEYLLEWYVVPSWKRWNLFSIAGLLVTLGGLVLRNLAIHTLGPHFTHQLPSHPPSTLVQHGIYSILRHPSYTGFFWYSVGTQLMLLNPLACGAYAYVLANFFAARIAEEEERLAGAAGWDAYRKRTAIWIPGVG
ncbi:Isoprenylcysteine carboxyl methyltransferase family-domain-containing protein [Hyaloraphidium curvatum]|nr:Isoprenylcysteine carboxyl methyltransferase family-domain-containing protein [Hyaloraphidium curvatum]